MKKVLQYQTDKKPIEFWGNGNTKRDFLYVDDCVDGLLRTAFYGTQGSVINLGSGYECSVKEMIEYMKSVMNFDYTFNGDLQYNGAPRRVMNIQKAKHQLGFKGTSEPYVNQLRTTWNWFVQHQHTQPVNYFQEPQGSKHLEAIRG